MKEQVIWIRSISLLAVVCLLGACTQRRVTAYEKYDYLLKNRDNRTVEQTETQGGYSVPGDREERYENDFPRRDEPIRESRNRFKPRVVKIAESYLGVPYRYGGASHTGMDCSGLVYRSFLAMGHKIPRTSLQQSQIGQNVNKRSLKPGDLVFFKTDKSSQKVNHVGIVVFVQGREVRFIHSSSSRGVKYDRLDEGYWQPLFRKAVRL